MIPPFEPQQEKTHEPSALGVLDIGRYRNFASHKKPFGGQEMKATFEIIPHQSPWTKFWIFTVGCVAGAAGAIGAMLIKERTEVRDGCVIFRHEGRTEEKSPTQEPPVAPENMKPAEGQGEGKASSPSTSEVQGDTPSTAQGG